MSAFIGEHRPLEHPITDAEVERPLNRHSNSRANGRDELSGELLKCGSEILTKPTADIFNRALTEQQTLSQLSKSGKPVGALTSLRPIVLLKALTEALSLVVLARRADNVDAFPFWNAMRSST